MNDELFHEELIAMHMYEQDHRKGDGGYAYLRPWFNLGPDERRKYRLQAKAMIQEAREPRG